MMSKSYVNHCSMNVGYGWLTATEFCYNGLATINLKNSKEIYIIYNILISGIFVSKIKAKSHHLYEN